MPRSRVASAHKPPIPPISAALETEPGFTEQAERLAAMINRLNPTERQQDVESVLWIAISVGLDEMERHYRGKEVAHA